MASYIGYKERTEKPIDWTKITGEIIDRTSEIEAGREAKRAELDKIVSDNESIVSKLEMGESDTFNEFAMRGVDEGRKMLYDSYNAMRRGEITPSEYKMRQQQQMSQWGEFSTATKTFNAKIAEVNKRAQEGTSSLIEMWKAEQQAQISELENQTLIWSPDGRLYMSKTDDEGKVINPNDVTSVSSFNKNGNLFVDRVNVEKAVSERTAKIAQFKKVIRQYGIDTKEGKDAMAGYEAFKKDLIGSLTSADMQVGSILMDDVGGFNLSKDPEDRTDQYTIKMVANKQGVTEPDFSDDGRMFVDPDDGKKKAIGPWQREQAEKRVDNSIELHVPDIETPTPIQRPQRPTRDELRWEKEQKDNFGYLKELDKMNKGDEDEFKEMANARILHMNQNIIKDEKKKIKSIERTEDEFIITLKDGTPYNVKRGDSTKNTMQQLSRILTPIGGAWENTYVDYLTKEKGGFGPANIKEARKEAARAPLKPITLSKTKFNSEDDKTVGQYLNDRADTDAEGKTAKAVDRVLATYLKAPDGKAIPFTVVGTDNTFENDELTVTLYPDTDKEEVVTIIAEDGEFDENKSHLNYEIEKLINRKRESGSKPKKKSILQLTKENPTLTKAEIAELWLNQ